MWWAEAPPGFFFLHNLYSSVLSTNFNRLFSAWYSLSFFLVSSVFTSFLFYFFSFRQFSYTWRFIKPTLKSGFWYFALLNHWSEFAHLSLADKSFIIWHKFLSYNSSQTPNDIFYINKQDYLNCGHLKFWKELSDVFLIFPHFYNFHIYI